MVDSHEKAFFSKYNDELLRFTKVFNFLFITLCLGREETEPKPADGFSLYPNPSQGSFTLEATAGEHIQVVAVYNTQGQLVWQKEFAERLPKVAIDLRESPLGLYLVKVSHEHAQQIIIK